MFVVDHYSPLYSHDNLVKKQTQFVFQKVTALLFPIHHLYAIPFLRHILNHKLCRAVQIYYCSNIKKCTIFTFIIKDFLIMLNSSFLFRQSSYHTTVGISSSTLSVNNIIRVSTFRTDFLKPFTSIPFFIGFLQNQMLY